MNTNENNQFGAKLNLRGRARQTGVRTLDYLKVNGKQNMIIIGASIILTLHAYKPQLCKARQRF